MADFFDFRRGGGTSLFSPCHLLWLISTLGLIVWCAIIARRHEHALRAIGLTLILTELTRITALFFTGMLDRGFLPLHLCGAAVYLSAIHSATENELIGELIFSTLTPGAVAALIFPEWLSYAPTSFLFLSSFGIHMLVCAYGAAMLSSGSFVPEVRRLPLCFALLIIYASAVYVIDRLLNVNYLFLREPAPGSPLEWFGTVFPWYALGYLPSLFVVWAIIYGIHAVWQKNRPPKRRTVRRDYY